jgi:hypothetical protein
MIMKKIILVLAALTFSFGLALAEEAEQKQPDNSDFMFNGSRDIMGVFTGQYDGTSPTWNRPIYPSGYDPDCNGAGAVSNTSTYMYAMHSFVAPYDAYIIATLENPISNCCDVTDMYFFLYCDPFSAATPLVNLRAGDDDAGTGFNSAFLEVDEIFVEGGATYHFVASHFGSINPPYSGPAVDYTITYSFTPVGEIPLANWALGIGLFLIIAVTLIRLKRMS